MNTAYLAVFVFGYALGSIPFGLLITRAFALPDPRGIGSGNIGATNVLRTGHKGAAALTLLLDGAKGAVAVLLARAFAPGLVGALSLPSLGPEAAALLAGLGAFAGHLFPVWLLFRGGKGVATFLGIFLAVAWPVGLIACGTWLVTAALFRISSLSAIVAAASTPVSLALFGRDDAVWLAVMLGVLLLFKHAQNLERMFLGTEPRIGST